MTKNHGEVIFSAPAWQSFGSRRQVNVGQRCLWKCEAGELLWLLSYTMLPPPHPLVDKGEPVHFGVVISHSAPQSNPNQRLQH